MKSEWEVVKKYLPEGWEAEARETGALVRSREIKSADDLLTLNLLYVIDGGSYQATSELMRLTAGISVNKNATRKRICGSWRWLRKLSYGVCKGNGVTIEKPEFVGERKVRLYDGSDIALAGGKGSEYRLHYVFDLFGFECREMEITKSEEGEKLTRHEISEGEISIGDRGYCTITGIEHVKEQKADYILRMRSKAFNLYNDEGEKIEILDEIGELKELESKEIRCYYRLKNGELRPTRVVVMRKSEACAQEARRKQEKENRRKQKKPTCKETIELSKYIVLVTSLEYTNAQILELYRARWQIEQVFLRLKELFGFGEIPTKNPDAAKAWFYGKLLVASLCEAMVRSFSPEEEKLLHPASQKSME